MNVIFHLWNRHSKRVLVGEISPLYPSRAQQVGRLKILLLPVEHRLHMAGLLLHHQHLDWVRTVNKQLNWVTGGVCWRPATAAISGTIRRVDNIIAITAPAPALLQHCSPQWEYPPVWPQVGNWRLNSSVSLIPPHRGRLFNSPLIATKKTDRHFDLHFTTLRGTEHVF